MKGNKGITLIALVITIIILIILAGISIAILGGEDGLITKAKLARQNMENASIEEQEQLNTIYGSLATGTGNVTIYDSIAEYQQQINSLQTELDTLKSDLGDKAATQDKILKDYQAYVNGQLVTGTIESKAAATYTPTTTNQTVASGQYLAGDQTILGDEDLVAENIKSGVDIFGVTGTLSNSTGDVSFSSVVRGSYGSGPIDCNVGDLIVVGANHSTINASGATLLNSFHAGHSSLDCYIYFYRATSEKVTFNGGSNAASAIWHSVVLYY